MGPADRNDQRALDEAMAAMYAQREPIDALYRGRSFTSRPTWAPRQIEHEVNAVVLRDTRRRAKAAAARSREAKRRARAIEHAKREALVGVVAEPEPAMPPRSVRATARTRAELQEMWNRAVAVTVGRLSERRFLGDGTPPRRLLVYERDGWACVECGATRNLTLDHIIPRCRGGDGSLGNLQTMCARCNNRKGAKMPKLAERAA